jgi:hypothetical protein
VIGGRDGVLGALEGSVGLDAGGAVLGVVVVVVSTAGASAASRGVASGVAAGGGELEAGAGALDGVVVGETAITIGATAALCSAGLTAEPTSTPKASNAITTTAAGTGDRPASKPGPRGPVARAGGGVPLGSTLPFAPPDLARGATPINSARASRRGPHRAPHSTQ